MPDKEYTDQTDENGYGILTRTNQPNQRHPRTIGIDKDLELI